jgi:hypothetical protein
MMPVVGVVRSKFGATFLRSNFCARFCALRPNCFPVAAPPYLGVTSRGCDGLRIGPRKPAVLNAKPEGEQSLSDDDLPPAPRVRRKKKKSSEAAAKPSGSGWSRYLLWAVMLCFALAAAIELRAQAYYRHNLRVAQGVLDQFEQKSKKVTYDEIKDRFWSTPEQSTGMSDFVPNVIYTWSWHGLRKYVVRLYVSPKDGQLRKVESEP